MIPKECKRLAEVDFPIAEVSRHAVREKSIRHGHPSALHLWWARRPLASSRAILLALLLPDPCDSQCPPAFKEQARNLLRQVQGLVGSSDVELRDSLLKFVGTFASWDLAAVGAYIEVARGLVSLAYDGESPLVVDPFAGGGSIPLEALRIGCDAFASDLNPVALMILRTVLNEIPRHAVASLSIALRTVGTAIQNVASNRLAAYYPPAASGSTPIAYLWARTVQCEASNCGAEIPLLRSFWLCKKSGRKRALRYHVRRPAGHMPEVDFEVFEPLVDSDVPGRTVSNAKATCLACGTVLSSSRVRHQLTLQQGGADARFNELGQRVGGARMIAVVSLKRGQAGRQYRVPTDDDYEPVRQAQRDLAQAFQVWQQGGGRGFSPVPSEPMNPVRPSPNARGLSAVTRYGMSTFGDLFTARQKLALTAFSELALEKYAEVGELAALCVSKLADLANSGCRWEAVAECPRQLYARQAIPMVWDFSEGVPTSESSGSFAVMVDLMCRNLDRIGANWNAGVVQPADAANYPLPDDSAAIWFTDPPYYDAIPYADLSDFFLVWLKRSIPRGAFVIDPFDSNSELSPKDRECVWNRAYLYDGRPKDKAFFELAIGNAFREGRRILSDDGIGAVVFAHQTTEGWEAFLSGLVLAGWTVTASWPIATEMSTRIRARENASLATSVHLICRPRPAGAAIGDWADVLRELPLRVGDWMERLQEEGVRGADLLFACIGPALEIFSRYSAVETTDGSKVALAEYLEKVWEVVGRAALAQVLGTAEARARNGAAGALEEDARLTALFLWTLESTAGDMSSSQHEAIDAQSDDDEDDDLVEDEDTDEVRAAGSRKGFTLVFDVVRRFAQPLGINLDNWYGRIIEKKKGVVRLLPVVERMKQLFGADGAQVVAARIEREEASHNDPLQGVLFPEMEPPSRVTRRRGAVPVNDELSGKGHATAVGTTTLDRVHAAMLLQASGQSSALRALLKAEQERSPDFLRLANALTALYPKASEEKRLLDAMLLAVPR